VDLSGADLDNVTRTIIAEAGQNGTPASMAAVRNRLAGGGYGKTPIAEAGQNGTPASMAAIRNRLAAGGYGKTPSEIVHAPNQFEPWNPGSGNDPRRFQADSPAYKQAQALLAHLGHDRPRHAVEISARKVHLHCPERRPFEDRTRS
jgi:Cell Wall Hydrolase